MRHHPLSSLRAWGALAPILALSVTLCAAADRMSPQEVSAAVKAAMDASTDPCRDFYQYACGGWLKKTTLPPDRPIWGSFSEIEERNLATLREILEAAAKSPSGDPDQARLGGFYASCVDEAAVERAGAAPLKPFLDEIATVKDAGSFMATAGRLHAHAVPALFVGFVLPDFKNPTTEISHVHQGGLGLPDREYYLKDDAESKELLGAYEKHVARMLELVGEAPDAAARHAGAIVQFETELAKVSLDKEAVRELDKLYHKLDIAGLKALAPQLAWDRFLSAMGYPGLTQVNVTVPDFFKGAADLVSRTEPDTLRAYLRWNLAHGTADLLSKPLVDENFAFFGKRLTGQQEIRPRWKRCVDATDAAMGELLGKAFVERAFAGDSKAIAVEMIQGVEAAFEAALPGLPWMDPSTRQRAVEKVKAVRNKIGYPDKWRDYSKLSVKPGDYFASSVAARVFEFRRNFDKVGGPVDKGEWGMTPPAVNAYYNPLNNEMVFPAGIMQRPFFHRDFPIAMNYGGIGMVMGHELMHGFDDQGRKFDAKGELTPWWEPEVVAKFEQAAQCVDDQYDTYEVLPGVNINGRLTLGENIADLGGVKQAYRAYKAWEKKHGAPKSPVEGLTNDQLFFVGYAHGWCATASPEYMKLMATVNPHSEPKYRVLGPLSNFPSFSEAFACKQGAAMRPEKICTVW